MQEKVLRYLVRSRCRLILERKRGWFSEKLICWMQKNGSLRMYYLAVGSAETGTLGWSTGETGIGHADSRAGMGGVSRIAAEHTDARTEF